MPAEDILVRSSPLWHVSLTGTWRCQDVKCIEGAFRILRLSWPGLLCQVEGDYVNELFMVVSVHAAVCPNTLFMSMFLWRGMQGQGSRPGHHADPPQRLVNRWMAHVR